MAPTQALTERRIRVVNALPVTEGAKGRLAGISRQLEIVHHEVGDPRWAREGLRDPDVEVLISSHPPSDLGRTPKLRWLQLGVAGVEHLDPEPLLRANIVVTNASGIHAVPIAEYALGAMLHVAKDVEERQANQRRHEWPADARLVGRLLRGRTVAIVGYGSVGREVGRMASAFGMRVLAVKASPDRRRRQSFRLPGTGDPNARIPERLVAPTALAEIVGEADYVVITLPATPETRGVVNAAVVGAMRESAWLINVGRGSCVDSRALEEALAHHRIGGAVLDVFETEPLDRESPFWDLPNCIVTPHISGGPPGAFDLLADLLVENLARYVQGRPLLNRVSPGRGY